LIHVERTCKVKLNKIDSTNLNVINIDSHISYIASYRFLGRFRLILISVRLRQNINRRLTELPCKSSSSCPVRCPRVDYTCPILSRLIIMSWCLSKTNVVLRHTENLISFSFVCLVVQILPPVECVFQYC